MGAVTIPTRRLRAVLVPLSEHSSSDQSNPNWSTMAILTSPDRHRKGTKVRARRRVPTSVSCARRHSFQCGSRKGKSVTVL